MQAAAAALSGASAWSPDPTHREGVPSANAGVSSRYGGNIRQNLQSRGAAGGVTQSRGAGGASGSERMGNRQGAPNASSGNRSAFGGVRDGSAARMQSDHGYSSLGAARSGGSASRGGGGFSRGGGGGGGGGGRGGGGGGGRGGGGAHDG